MKNQAKTGAPTVVAASGVVETQSVIPATAEIAAPQAEETVAQRARRERAEAMKINKPPEAVDPDDEDKEDPPAPSAKRVRTPSVSKEPKTEFVLDLALQTELKALSGPELIQKAVEAKVLRPVDAANLTLFGLGQNTDHFHGQPVARSSVRGAIYDFVESRQDKRATMAEICAYMELGRNRLFKGKFNAGYVSTSRSEDSKRGMVARRQLVIISRPAKPEAAPATTEAV